MNITGKMYVNPEKPNEVLERGRGRRKPIYFRDDNDGRLLARRTAASLNLLSQYDVHALEDMDAANHNLREVVTRLKRLHRILQLMGWSDEQLADAEMGYGLQDQRI